MLILAAIGGGAFVLASLVVSLRLLALARRTRELPEFLIGLGLLLMGGIGYPLSTLARLSSDDLGLQAALFACHGLLSLTGQSAVALFNWRVFRRDESWGRAFALGYIALMSTLVVWQTLSPGWRAFARAEQGPWTLLPALSLVVLGWAGAESLGYYAKLKKRLALGLAEAVTTDRLRLWAIAMLAAFTTSLLVQLLRLMGVKMTGEVTGLIVGPLGVVSASAMWLAFLPPKRYVDRVLARAAAARA
jgi:hypothetical protein